MSLSKILRSLSKNELAIIKCESAVRNVIHSYVDEELNTGHAGVHLSQFTSCSNNYKGVFKQCFECDKWLKLNYGYGYDENNIDESYSADCDNCDEGYVCWYCSYDPNPNVYDEVIRTVYYNNSICVGRAIKLEQGPWVKTVNYEHIDSLLVNVEVIKIKTGGDWFATGNTGSRSRKHKNVMQAEKHRLEEYIDECFKGMDL